MNADGNVIGRLGALAVIVVTVWGVGRINAGKFAMCPVEKTSASCCMGETKPAADKPAEAKPADAKAAPAAPAPKH